MTLTQRDFDEIEKMMDEKFEEQLRNIPTKDEFYAKMDEVMGELKGIREEVTVVTHQVSGHEDRIVKLEQKTGLASV
ncbi:hypothetical protein MUP46_00060 [Patescibacteria group bacterium]|nr:hypothetical protein [Patescibacteria group bacterium]